MKKSTMKVIITAAVMIVAGIGLCIGGVLATGGVDAAREEILKSGIDLSHVYSFDADSNLKLGTEEVTGMFGTEEVVGLDLEIGAAKVEFTNGSFDGEITVQANDHFKIYEKNRVLYVKSVNMAKDEKITIEIPQDIVLQKVEISGNSCEVKIPYIEAKEFDIEADAGLVEIDRLIADQAEFDIGAGEIVVNDGTLLGCDVNVGMGSFEYYGSIKRRGDVECGMGNAELQLDGSEEDYNYAIECSAGNVTIGNDNYSGLAVEKVVNNNADAAIEIECSVGNVTIGF